MKNIWRQPFKKATDLKVPTEAQCQAWLAKYKELDTQNASVSEKRTFIAEVAPICGAGYIKCPTWLQLGKSLRRIVRNKKGNTGGCNEQ